MKILMTGSSGFIGSHLKPYLKDHEIYHLESDLRHHGLVRTEVKDFQPGGAFDQRENFRIEVLPDGRQVVTSLGNV